MPDTARQQLLLPFDPVAPPNVSTWLAALEDTRRRTWEALEGLPDTLLDWVDEEGTSIGVLLYHIAAVELDWLYVEILDQPFPAGVEQLFPFDMRDAEGKLMAVRGETLAAHRRRLDRMRAYLVDAMQAMPAEEFVRVRHLPAYDVSPLWVLHHLMQHEAEHRGQIMALRRRAAGA